MMPKNEQKLLVSEATAHINQLVSEHEIMQKAYEEANQIIEQAQAEAQGIFRFSYNRS